MSRIGEIKSVEKKRVLEMDLLTIVCVPMRIERTKNPVRCLSDRISLDFESKRLGRGFLHLFHGIDSAAHADEVGILLEIEGDGANLDFALFENAFDDFLLGHGAILAEQFLDHVGHGAGLIAPGGQGVQAATHEHELVVADQLVVDSLDRDHLLVEAGLGNAVGDLHKMQWFLGFLQNNDGLVADAAGVHMAPFHQAPFPFHLAGALVGLEAGDDELTRNVPSLEKIQVLDAGVDLLLGHDLATLFEDGDAGFRGLPDVGHGDALEHPIGLGRGGAGRFLELVSQFRERTMMLPSIWIRRKCSGACD